MKEGAAYFRRLELGKKLWVSFILIYPYIFGILKVPQATLTI